MSGKKKKNGPTPAEYTKKRFEIQKQAEIWQQRLEEILLQTQQEQRNLFERTNRGQISENENVFSRNTIWGAIDNFTYCKYVQVQILKKI